MALKKNNNKKLDAKRFGFHVVSMNNCTNHLFHHPYNDLGAAIDTGLIQTADSIFPFM